MPNEMPLSVNSNAECVAIYSSNNISNNSNSSGQRIKQNENKIKWRVAYTHFALSLILSYARLAIGYSQSHSLSGIRSLSPFPFLLLRAACLCVISVYKLLLLFVGARTHWEQANWVWVASSLFLTLLTLSVCMYVCIQEHVCVCVCTKFSFVCHSYAPVYPPVQPYLRWRLYNIAIFSLPLHLLIFRRNIETHNHNKKLVTHKRKIGKWVSFSAI